MTEKELRKKAMALPQQPGVYIMKNKDKKIIYIGKAKSLRIVYHLILALIQTIL